MLLFDAIFINVGGGKELLDQMIAELDKKTKDVIYLLDERVKGSYPFLDNSKVFYLKGSLVNRHIYYKKNYKLFTKIFVFGNIPPTIKTKGITVYTYFHNVLLLSPLLNFTFDSILLLIKSYVLKLLYNNTDFWVVQTKLVKNLIIHNFKIPQDRVLIYPIFNLELICDQVPINKFYSINDGIKFLYVSEGYSHKGHINLIKAFEMFNKISPNSVLTLTVSDKYYDKIVDSASIYENVCFINNKGILNKSDLNVEYQKSDVFIYPSHFESFGLGLIEAAFCKLPIISADLPYVYEVVEPCLVFDPHSVISIYNVLVESSKIIGFHSSIKVGNKLLQFLNILIK